MQRPTATPAVFTVPGGTALKRLLVPIVALFSVSFMSPIAMAQEATPASPPPPGLIVPDPSDCRVEPRPISFFEQLVATPPAMSLEEASKRFSEPGMEPVVIPAPVGEPADAAMAEAATMTLHEALACLNASDTLRFLALFTDEMIHAFFRLEPLPPEALSFLAATPVASPPEQWLGYLSVHDVVVLPDGRVAALGATYDPTEPPFGVADDLAILKQVGGRWLIDTLIENAVLEGTATPTG